MSKDIQSLEKILPIYTNLMEEIKLRMKVLDDVINNNVNLAPMPAFELGYVQLRKICEIFALSCLVAHGDIKEIQTKLVQGMYSANDIIKKLSNLHSDFYPVPKWALQDEKGQRLLAKVEDGYLTKQELVKLYGECGQYLHRGSIKQLLKNWEPNPDLNIFRLWRSKIIVLLNEHWIQTIYEGVKIVCQMQTEQGVQTSIFTRVDDAPPYQGPRIAVKFCTS